MGQRDSKNSVIPATETALKILEGFGISERTLLRARRVYERREAQNTSVAGMEASETELLSP